MLAVPVTPRSRVKLVAYKLIFYAMMEVPVSFLHSSLFHLYMETVGRIWTVGTVMVYSSVCNVSQKYCVYLAVVNICKRKTTYECL